MEVYVARQPIFDSKMKVYGYELLYRRSLNNFFEGTDDNQATAELINNAYLVMQLDELAGGTKAFINFSQELLEKEIPLLLPPETIVIEILERVEPSESVIKACRKLKEKGYTLALDDFAFYESYQPLVEIADIIKIEFPVVGLEKQRELISKYKNKTKFLAEKIETREEYQFAIDMGYDYFQGYFFSKPTIISSKEIEGLNTSLLRIVNELNLEEPDYQKIAEIIEKDLGLSYKFLKLANAIFFGSRNKIYSIKQALVRLGTNEIKKWIYLIMLKEVQSIENKELVKSCLVRGKLMELIALETDIKSKHLEFYLTGFFSSIDILLNRDMKDIISELPLTIDVKGALLGECNQLYRALNTVRSYEMADWNKFENLELYYSIHREKFMMMYIEALKWTMALDY